MNATETNEKRDESDLAEAIRDLALALDPHRQGEQWPDPVSWDGRPLAEQARDLLVQADARGGWWRGSVVHALQELLAADAAHALRVQLATEADSIICARCDHDLYEHTIRVYDDGAQQACPHCGLVYEVSAAWEIAHGYDPDDPDDDDPDADDLYGKDDDGDLGCDICGVAREERTCADCGETASVIDCGHHVQPAEIAASKYGGDPVCEDCEPAREAAEASKVEARRCQCGAITGEYCDETADALVEWVPPSRRGTADALDSWVGLSERLRVSSGCVETVTHVMDDEGEMVESQWACEIDATEAD